MEIPSQARFFGLLLVLATLAGACSGAPPGGVELSGRVLDASTNEPVARESLLLHFFCDEIGFQQSLETSSSSSYDVEMPKRTVRVRAFDPSSTYHLYEQTVTATGPEHVHDILLEPTNYVLLHGRILDRATGKPLPRPADPKIGDVPLFSFHCEAASFAKDYIAAGDGGAYALRVPRDLIDVQALDTPKRVALDHVDLRGYEGDAYEFDIELE